MEKLTAPERQVIMIQAPDDKTARKRAKVHQTGRSQIVKRVNLITPGSKGFLGIGRRLDEYEVKVIHRAVVEGHLQADGKDLYTCSQNSWKA